MLIPRLFFFSCETLGVKPLANFPSLKSQHQHWCVSFNACSPSKGTERRYSTSSSISIQRIREVSRVGEKWLISHLPWVGNWRWYSWDPALSKVSAESQALLLTLQKPGTREKVFCWRFLPALSIFTIAGKQEDGSKGRIWSNIRSRKLLASFPTRNCRKGNWATTLSVCSRALGNVHVLSVEQSFPCSSQRSLGGHVVWFISLNCQLMNGTQPSTATHTQRETPLRGPSQGSSHSH